MSAQGAIRAGSAYVELGLTDTIAQGLNKAAKKLKTFGDTLKTSGLDTVKLGVAIVAPLAASARAFSQHGEAIERGSQQTGLGAESFSTLANAAENTGTSTESLTGGIEKMSRTLAEARAGSAEAQKSFADLGLTVGNLGKLSQEDRFKLIADRISQIKDPADKAAAAMSIFGRGGAELLPLLNKGSQGITAMQQHARDLGLEWSGPETAAAVKFSKTLKDLWAVFQRGVDAVGAAVVPAFTTMANSLIAGGIQAKVWAQAHQGVIAIALGVGAAMATAGAAIYVLGGALESLGVIFSTVSAAIALTTGAMELLFTPLAIVPVVAGVAIAALLKFTDVGSFLSGVFGTLKTDAMAAFDGIKNAMKAGDFSTAANILWNAIKLEWDKGALYIKSAISDLLKPWVGVIGEMERTWSTLTTFAQTAWSDFTAYVASAWNKLNLGPIFAAVWADFKDGIKIAADAVVVGFSVIQAVVTHWKDSLSLAWASIQLGAVRAVNEMVYAFTELLPTAFGWLTANGPKIVAGVCLKIFDEIGNLIKQVWAYVANVAPKIGAALWDAIKSGAKATLDFDKASFDAFRRGFSQDAAQTGGPQFQPRVVPKTETDLQNQVDQKAGTVGDEIQKTIDENRATVARLTDALAKMTSPTAGDAKAGTAALPDVAKATNDLAAAQARLNASLAKADPSGTVDGTVTTNWDANGNPIADGIAQGVVAAAAAAIGNVATPTNTRAEAKGTFAASQGLISQIFGSQTDVAKAQLAAAREQTGFLKKIADKVGPMRAT